MVVTLQQSSFRSGHPSGGRHFLSLRLTIDPLPSPAVSRLHPFGTYPFCCSSLSQLVGSSSTLQSVFLPREKAAASHEVAVTVLRRLYIEVFGPFDYRTHRRSISVLVAHRTQSLFYILFKVHAAGARRERCPNIASRIKIAPCVVRTLHRRVGGGACFKG